MDKASETMNKAIKKFGKQYMFIETAYPAHEYKNMKKKNQAYYLDAMRFPLSARGQTQFLRELIVMAKSNSKGNGGGVIWWFPESINPPSFKAQKRRGLRIPFKAWKNGATALFHLENDTSSMNLKAYAKESLRALSAD